MCTCSLKMLVGAPPQTPVDSELANTRRIPSPGVRRARVDSESRVCQDHKATSSNVTFLLPFPPSSPLTLLFPLPQILRQGRQGASAIPDGLHRRSLGASALSTASLVLYVLHSPVGRFYMSSILLQSRWSTLSTSPPAIVYAFLFYDTIVQCAPTSLVSINTRYFLPTPDGFARLCVPHDRELLAYIRCARGIVGAEVEEEEGPPMMWLLVYCSMCRIGLHYIIIGFKWSKIVGKLVTIFRDQSILTFFENLPIVDIRREMSVIPKISPNLLQNVKGGFS
ncbi:hypothetical protein B0H11DRAFT_1945319 [Mycena galericulata]|nr:hypothetical protein B0H11DRAFT_1945319 [Mycena galericulata]